MFRKLLAVSVLGVSLALSSQAMARPGGGDDRPRFGASHQRDHGKHHDRRHRGDHGKHHGRGHRWDYDKQHRNHSREYGKHYRNHYKHYGNRHWQHHRRDHNRWHHRGHAYRWQRGHYVPHQYRHSHYVLHNYHRHGLYRPPRGYHWLHVNNEYLLTAIATGVIAAVVIGGH